MIIFTIKTYGLLHAISIIMFKRSKNKQNNIFTLIKEFIFKILKSCCFMGGYMTLLRISFCLISKILGKYNVFLSIMQATLCSFVVMFEPTDRIQNLSSFVISKSIQSLLNLLIKIGKINYIPTSVYILFAITMISVLNLYIIHNNNINNINNDNNSQILNNNKLIIKNNILRLFEYLVI